MELLSEACAAVSTPKFFCNTFNERPIQPIIRYDFGKKTTSSSRQGFLPFHRRELSNKGQGVMGGKAPERSEIQLSDHEVSDVDIWKGGKVRGRTPQFLPYSTFE